MTYAIGIDPDLKHTAIAAVSMETGKVAGVWSVPAKGDKGRDQVLLMIEAVARFIEADELPNGDQVSVAAVEGQEIVYSAAAGRNPRSMLFLGHVSGSLLMALRFLCRESVLLFPAPQEWKGSVPKTIHQGRIFGKLGWAYERVGSQEDGYCRPTQPPAVGSPDAFIGVDQISKGQWKHVGDAIGLALWARDEYTKQTLREATHA